MAASLATAKWLLEKPMAWAPQTWKSLINFKHLTDVRKNRLQTWILSAWKLLGFSGHSLQQQYKGTLFKSIFNLYQTHGEAQ